MIANMMACGAGSVKCLYYLFALTSVLVVGIAVGDFVRLNENSHLPIILFSSKVVILFCGRHIYQLDIIVHLSHLMLFVGVYTKLLTEIRIWTLFN